MNERCPRYRRLLALLNLIEREPETAADTMHQFAAEIEAMSLAFHDPTRKNLAREREVLKWRRRWTLQ
jgi:hypothetical protein